jgi:hypothetical protein
MDAQPYWYDHYFPRIRYSDRVMCVGQLSGGAYLGYYHIGVVLSLIQQNMLPRVISGASAGSLIAAFVGLVNHGCLLFIFLIWSS